MDLQAFWKSKGISDKVAETAEYTYFGVDDIANVVEACTSLGKPDDGVRGWAGLFSDTDGIIIPTRCLVTGKQKMPQVKPFISVKTGQALNHLHGSDQDVWDIIPQVVDVAYCVVKMFEGKRKLVFRHSHAQLLPEELDTHLATFHARTRELDDTHSHSVACYKQTNQPIQAHINKGAK